MISVFWSGILTALAWLPLQLVRVIRHRRLGRRGMVTVDLGRARSRGALGRTESQVRALREMARDRAVRGVVVNLRNLRLGWASLQDLREALRGLRDAGKLVVMHLDDIGTRELYIASVADRVWLPPSTEVILSGLAARLIFFRDALDLAGLRVEVEAAGRFKSFGEPYSRAWPSPANREQISALVHDLQDQIVSGIAEGRGVAPEVVLDAMARSPVPAEDLVEAGLVDGVAYADEARLHLEELLDGRLRSTRFAVYAWWAWLQGWLEDVGRRDPAIAVVHLEGPIVHGAEASGGTRHRIDADRVVPVLDRLRGDCTVRGVVLHVDSPGGNALASDLIARAVRRLGEKKPVVAAFGDVSASGGYYVAAPAQEIVCRPGTITGSIGVVAGKLVIGPAAARVGVHAEVVRAGPDSGLMSSWEPLTSDQRTRLRGLLDRSYARFLQVVSAGRRLPIEAVDAVAGGRVWTGQQALEHGLVDHLGDLETALGRVRSLSGLPDTPRSVIHLRFPPPRFRVISALLRRDEVVLPDILDLLERVMGHTTLQGLRLLRAAPGQALALLPWDVDPR